MQAKTSKRLHNVVIEFANGVTRTVKVKAISREHAENRALKFHPNAIGIKRNAS